MDFPLCGIQKKKKKKREREREKERKIRGKKKNSPSMPFISHAMIRKVYHVLLLMSSDAAKESVE